ncbi:MAG: hypothetical protein L0215_20075 [Gemmataceae bacterium]|nr:hypothetical protein [Gemmataceae bacterium]
MNKRTLLGLLCAWFVAGCVSSGGRRDEAESQFVKTAATDRPVTAADITPENAHQLYERLLDEIDRQ